MYIPRYWKLVRYELPPSADAAHDPGEEPENRVRYCWGWSDESEADAEAVGLRRAADILARGREGWTANAFADDPAYADLSWEDRGMLYNYSRLPLREEIVDTIYDGSGRPQAYTTRNSYGSLILNAAQVMFVDVDLPPPTLAGCLGALLGMEPPSQESQMIPLIDRARKFVERQPRFGLRMYRTANGLRFLVTHETFDPASAESDGVLAELGCDPAYRHLCRIQKSYRARLTPKYWRCDGLKRPPYRYPYRTEKSQAAMQAWRREYDREIQNWATCHLVETLGAAQMNYEASTIVEIHDRISRVGSGLPLA